VAYNFGMRQRTVVISDNEQGLNRAIHIEFFQVSRVFIFFFSDLNFHIIQGSWSLGRQPTQAALCYVTGIVLFLSCFGYYILAGRHLNDAYNPTLQEKNIPPARPLDKGTPGALQGGDGCNGGRGPAVKPAAARRLGPDPARFMSELLARAYRRLGEGWDPVCWVCWVCWVAGPRERRRHQASHGDAGADVGPMCSPSGTRFLPHAAYARRVGSGSRYMQNVRPAPHLQVVSARSVSSAHGGTGLPVCRAICEQY
jgi:hypothetical protein